MEKPNVKFQRMNGSCELLSGEIKGASTFTHELSASREISLSSINEARIFIVCRGSAEINGMKRSGRALFAFASGEKIVVRAVQDTLLLEIRWKLLDGESVKADTLPCSLAYDDAVRYKEECKSEKTTSRMLLPEGIIPRIAIGSVETYGLDRIEKHEHPFCDQLFFSFAENDMNIMIDDFEVHMGGDTLLHIPLASSHGVRVSESGAAHYIWIDFIIDPRGIEYMHSAHEEI
jgi:hypothetical protein